MYKLLLCRRYLRTCYIASASIALRCGRIAALLYVLLVVPAHGQVASELVSLSDVQEILAPRIVDVEILGDKALPEDIQDINLRMRSAASNHPEWFAELIASRKPGEPLQYHKNFGVSHQEWDRFHGFMTNLAMVPVATGRLQFTAINDGQIRIDSLQGLPELNGIVVDFERNEVQTRWGNASATDPVEPSKEQKATGPMSMCQWRFETDDRVVGNATSVELSLGRLIETPHNLIYLRVTQFNEWKLSAKYRTVVQFAR